jgi:hypothetical protein
MSEVIYLPTKDTEPPLFDRAELGYILELEQENSELRDLVATQALSLARITDRPSRPFGRVRSSAAVLLAFAAGCMIDTDSMLNTSAHAQSAIETDCMGSILTAASPVGEQCRWL